MLRFFQMLERPQNGVVLKAAANGVVARFKRAQKREVECFRATTREGNALVAVAIK